MDCQRQHGPICKHQCSWYGMLFCRVLINTSNTSVVCFLRHVHPSSTRMFLSATVSLIHWKCSQEYMLDVVINF
jgi:hypothetical protein